MSARGQYVRAVCPFTAAGGRDLSLSPGDVVALMAPPIHDVDPSAWLYGHNVLSNQMGYFPRSHVHPLTDSEVMQLGQRARLPTSVVRGHVGEPPGMHVHNDAARLHLTSTLQVAAGLRTLSFEPSGDRVSQSATRTVCGTGAVSSHRAEAPPPPPPPPLLLRPAPCDPVADPTTAPVVLVRPRPGPISADEWREIINDSGYGGSPSKAHHGRPIFTHLLQAVFFVSPILCVHCGDYIWGSGAVGQQCTECTGCFHNSCACCSPLHSCQRTNGEITTPHTHSEPVPINKWTSANVQEWMASINLINPVEIFKAKNLTGEELLNLDADKLLLLGIKDPYIQNMLLLGIQRLRADEGGVAGPPRVPSSPTVPTAAAVGGHSAGDHQLRPASFCNLLACQVCSCYLLGADHQGLACIDCGLVVHRQCGAQPGALPVCERSGSGNSATDSVFGADLARLFQPGCYQAGPPLLVSCLALLERRCQLQTGLNCHQLYEHTVSWDELRPLRLAVDQDPEGLDLDLFETSHVASLVKKFLAHLPNPVIPVQLYPQLVALTDKYMESCGDDCSVDVDTFVALIPTHHLCTLRLLANHLCRLCHLQQSRGCRYPPAQLIRTLSFLLVRPPFEQITLWPERAVLHTRALELLLMNHEWGSQPFPQWDPAPALPPRPGRQSTAPPPPPRRPGASSASAPSAPTSDQQLALERSDWYWGNISREEVSEKLAGQPDGTFLVRDSHTAGGEYTLTLRKGGNNRLIRIYCRAGRYGFSEPCQFDSVVQLVEHYRSESLRDYNAQLDVRLETPLVETRQYGEKYSTGELLVQLTRIHARHVKKLEELESLEKHRAVLADRLAVQRKAREAFEEVLRMLVEQQELHRAFTHKAQLHERALLADNWSLLEGRVVQVQQGLRQVEEEVRRQTSYFRTTEHELSVLHQEERRLLEQKRELERELVRRGVRRERLERLLAGEEEKEDGEEQLDGCTEPLEEPEDFSLLPPPLEDAGGQQLWLLEDCDRGRAQALLRDKQDGTFLMRRRANGQYALSVVALRQVQHCCIVQTDAGLLGFSLAHAVHPSLQTLVQHYRTHDLAEHNQLLPVRLLHPALAPQPASL